MRVFRDVAQRVRTHICYAQVFRDALTRTELVALCCPEDPDDVDRELNRLEVERKLERVGEYYFLRGCSIPNFGSIKQERRDLAQSIVDEDHRILRLLKRLSFVKLIAISGSIARDNAIDESRKPIDLDLFMITARSSLQIIRFMLRGAEIVSRLLVSLRLAGKLTKLCPNYLTESSFVEITNKSFFTATDTLNVKILKGEDEYRRFLAANYWIKRFYPVKLRAPAAKDDREIAPFLRSVVNAVCFSALSTASWIKARLRRRTPVYSIRFRYDRAHSFRRCGHPGGGHQPQIAKRFDEIYRRYFEADAELQDFLFPDTTDTGVYYAGAHSVSLSKLLGYDD